MLEDIRRLKQTVTEEQKKQMTEVLGDEAMVTFECMLTASDEDTCGLHLAKFKYALRRNILKSLKIYRNILTEEQREIVEKFIDD